jgi:glycosyltransferase involved in cell wall biosynthesis
MSRVGDDSIAPYITVLVPTHNRADVLPFAIRSILAQTLTNFELLVVGDGCTDNTAAVVHGLADPRIRWLDFPKAPNFGYANRNRALREARGELIAYLGHDDLWLPDHLALLAAYFERPDVELAYSRPLSVMSDGTILPVTNNLDDPVMLRRFVALQTSLGPSCMVHRRSCLERYGYWDESIPRAGDRELWIRFINGGGRHNFAYCDTPTSLHFVANWRKMNRKARLLLKLRLWDGSVPVDLQIPIPTDMTEQEAFWRSIETGPAAWTERTRRAVRVQLDRFVRMEYPSAWVDFLVRQSRSLLRRY